MHHEVLQFWFVETAPKQWWQADPGFDATITRRFAAAHRAAMQGELWRWRNEPQGRLAEIIVLDQFSRNMFRGQAAAFAADAMALLLAQEAVAGSHDGALTAQERMFMLMPFVHSESRVIHREAERHFEALGLPDSLESERRHKAIIDRFGRYPHRNEVLGRASTAEERDFLKRPGSRF